MTPSESIAEQAQALVHAAGVRVRDDLALVRVSGDDRRSWLNGQVTNDVRELAPGASVYALAVNVRGKILSDLWVLDRGDQLVVLLPQTAQAAVLASFEQQIIMEDVELGFEPETLAISVQGPRAREVLGAGEPLGVETHAFDELGYGGMLVLCSAAQGERVSAELRARACSVGGGAVSEQGFELARVRSGRPRFGSDFGDQQYPQEAGLKQLAVSFNKGCYLGQEVVCTLENRGRLSRELVRLAALEGPMPEVGAGLHDPAGAQIGKLTSVVHDPDLGRALALGYVKRAHAAAGGELHAGETRLQVLGPAGAS
jgi:folate-binding protein YgfZ